MTEEPQPPPVEEAIDYKDKYLRLLADAENVRKRLQKEKQESLRFGIENILAELLGPLDNFENALKYADQMSPEVKNWAFGFQMILAQLKEILTQNGVAPFVSVGEMFDPIKHEAVEMEETSDSPAGTILAEFVKGYRCGERIIRPARVKVAKKINQKEGEINHDIPEEEK
jgi:molecular chaperone GrpE